MAETLGSLVDKLAIKSIREFYLDKMIDSGDEKFSQEELREKKRILLEQKKSLREEIEEFIASAAVSEKVLRDEKLKLYNKRETMGKVGGVKGLSEGIETLTKKNFDLWQLEDEARREDVPLEYIGQVKRKIDAANQQRNDLIDRIDELFEEKLRSLKEA